MKRISTRTEKTLLTVSPGITDFASIVFSDEGDILEGHADPDLAYNQLIRPWKNRLALANIKHASVALDLQIMILTVVALFSRKKALAGVQRILQDLDVDDDVCTVALRDRPLEPTAPPGATADVLGRTSN